jgi:hypothetical protein
MENLKPSKFMKGKTGQACSVWLRRLVGLGVPGRKSVLETSAS